MKENSNKFFEKSRITVDENQTAIRLDVFLFDKMPNVTRNKIKEGIKEYNNYAGTDVFEMFKKLSECFV